MTNLPDTHTVLEAIADRLRAEPRLAALAHYPTLRIQTRNIHDAFSRAIADIDALVEDWRAALTDDLRVRTAFAAPDTANHTYRVIAPALAGNLHKSARFLLEESWPADPVGIERAQETAPSHGDFLKLGVAVRAFLDALVQTAYQFATFDGRQLNYKFLQSLASFAGVAPASLHANIVSTDIQAALDAFMALTPKERKDSTFTKAAHEQFTQRLDTAAELAGFSEWKRNNIRLVFGFCSDLIHAGYTSALALEEPKGDIIFGGDSDAFVARAENLAELNQRLLESCASGYAGLLLPALTHAIEATLDGGAPADWTALLERHQAAIGEARAQLGRQLVEPVRKSLIVNGGTARVTCTCGGHADFTPPHHEWDRFCRDCGARFVLLELPDAVDYVISDLGAGDVLGGDAPKIALLAPSLRAKLKRIVARHKPDRNGPDVNFRAVTDLEHCDEETLEVPTKITAAPPIGLTAELRAFVPTKSLERCATVRIRCNCGTDVDYDKKSGSLLCQCANCGRRIGLIGVSGTITEIPMSDANGREFSAPVQARNRFSVPDMAISDPI